VAQAIIKFMEDKEEYTGTSSELHKKLEGVAESLGVSLVRDKEWPKSARWLWRRIKEVLPLLVAAGIEASRKDAEKATEITLRRMPTDDCSDPSEDGSGIGTTDSPGNKGDTDSRSNSSSGTNSSPDSNAEPRNHAGSGITGNTGVRNVSSSETVGIAEEHSWDCLCEECLPT
jgi:hypothetical protein